METSRIKLARPFPKISSTFLRLTFQMGFKWFSFERKWLLKIRTVRVVPVAVASMAPPMPHFMMKINT